MRKLAMIATLLTVGIFTSCQSYTTLKKTNKVYEISATGETSEQMVTIYHSKKMDVSYKRLVSFKDKSSVGRKKDLKNLSLTTGQIDKFIEENPDLLMPPKGKDIDDYLCGNSLYFLTCKDGKYQLVTKYKWAKPFTPRDGHIRPENYDIHTDLAAISDSYHVFRSCYVVIPTQRN